MYVGNLAPVRFYLGSVGSKANIKKTRYVCCLFSWLLGKRVSMKRNFFKKHVLWLSSASLLEASIYNYENEAKFKDSQNKKSQ